jgi:uncharacterized protein (DUF2384 family)
MSLRPPDAPRPMDRATRPLPIPAAGPTSLSPARESDWPLRPNIALGRDSGVTVAASRPVIVTSSLFKVQCPQTLLWAPEPSQSRRTRPPADWKHHRRSVSGLGSDESWKSWKVARHLLTASRVHGSDSSRSYLQIFLNRFQTPSRTRILDESERVRVGRSLARSDSDLSWDPPARWIERLGLSKLERPTDHRVRPSPSADRFRPGPEYDWPLRPP